MLLLLCLFSSLLLMTPELVRCDDKFSYSEDVSIKFSEKCPENCNKHGKCIDNDYCVCDDGWAGNSCAYVNYHLSADHPLSVTIKQNQYIYFDISTKVPPFNNMTVFVQTFTKSPNTTAPAVYVANGYYPNSTHSQYNDSRIDHKKSLVILNPAAGQWSIALMGRDTNPTVLTIQVNMDDVCFSKCSSNGKCTPPDESGYVKCQCYDQFKGDFCEEYTEIMKNGSIHTGYVSIGFWNFWHFNITVDPTDTTFLTLTVGSIREGVDPPSERPGYCSNYGHIALDIYTQMNGHPTSAQHICVMPSIESKVAYSSNYTCVVKDKALLGRGNSWYIGILGTTIGYGNYTVLASLYLSGSPPVF